MNLFVGGQGPYRSHRNESKMVGNKKTLPTLQNTNNNPSHPSMRGTNHEPSHPSMRGTIINHNPSHPSIPCTR